MNKNILIIGFVMLVGIAMVTALSDTAHTPIGVIDGDATELVSIMGDDTLILANYDIDSLGWVGGMTCSGDNCSKTVDLTSLIEGEHTIRYFIMHDVLPGYTTDNYTFTIDRVPDAPTGIIVQEYNDTALKITWDANLETDIDYYRLFNNDSGLWNNIANTTATEYMHDGLTRDKDYFYKVTAVDTVVPAPAYESTASAIENGKITSTSGDINITITDEPPQYSNIVEPADPSIYSSIATYLFSSNWIDDIAVDFVTLNFGSIDYSTTKAVDTYSHTFGALDAGTYTYYFTGNDSIGQTNTTGNYTFTINKATPVVSLTADDWTINAGLETNINCSDNTGTAVLNRNSTIVTSPERKKLLPGTYAYNCSVPSTVNYNYIETENTLTVLDIDKLYLSQGIHPQTSAAPGNNIILNFSVTLAGGDYVRARMTDLISGAFDIQIDEESQPVLFCEEDYDPVTKDYDGSGPIYYLNNLYDLTQDAINCTSLLTAEEVPSFRVMLKIPIPSNQMEGNYNGNIYLQMYDTPTK